MYVCVCVCIQSLICMRAFVMVIALLFLLSFAAEMKNQIECQQHK